MAQVRSVTIKEGEAVKPFYLLSTLPIVCANNCPITARWITKNDDANMRNSVCSVTLQRAAWKNNEQKAYDLGQPIRLEIETDFVVREWKATEFEFAKFNFVTGQLPLWHNYQIPPVHVSTLTHYKNCYENM